MVEEIIIFIGCVIMGILQLVLLTVSSWKQTEVVVPGYLSDYQKHMMGVDLLYQMVVFDQFKHHSKKWWRAALLSAGC